jgi:hypothetical protein
VTSELGVPATEEGPDPSGCAVVVPGETAVVVCPDATGRVHPTTDNSDNTTAAANTAVIRTAFLRGTAVPVFRLKGFTPPRSACGVTAAVNIAASAGGKQRRSIALRQTSASPVVRHRLSAGQYNTGLQTRPSCRQRHKETERRLLRAIPVYRSTRGRPVRSQTRHNRLFLYPNRPSAVRYGTNH